MSSRLTNYELGINPERITAILTSAKDAMVDRYGDWAIVQAGLYDQVKVILVDQAVGVSEWIQYFNFMFRIWRLQQVAGAGAPFDSEAAILKARWISDGSNTVVLQAILDGMFTTP